MVEDKILIPYLLMGTILELLLYNYLAVYQQHRKNIQNQITNHL